MAWNSLTWKDHRTTSSDDPDPLDELVSGAQRDLDFLRTEEVYTGELIEGAEGVTFVLIAPGYSRRELSVKAGADRLVIEASDFKIAKPLGCTVDPNTARSTYVNGVLSVRVDKKF